MIDCIVNFVEIEFFGIVRILLKYDTKDEIYDPVADSL